MLTAVVTAVFTAWIFNVASNHSLFKEDTVMPDMVVAWMDALVPVTITLVLVDHYELQALIYHCLFVDYLNQFQHLVKHG